LKETRPLWPPQRGVGLREPNLGKTNPRVSLHYSLAICFVPSLVDLIIFLTLTRLVVVIIFENFSFALFTPPLGDFQEPPQRESRRWRNRRRNVRRHHEAGERNPEQPVSRDEVSEIGETPEERVFRERRNSRRRDRR
jgi:hypothetical protein